MDEREKIINWLNSIETRFDVTGIKIYDLHIWPILRWYIFQQVVNNREEYKRNTPSTGRIQKIRNRLVNLQVIISGSLLYLKLRLGIVKKGNFLFAGSHNYRVYHNNSFINRFLYPIANWLKINDIQFIYADHAAKNKKAYPFPYSHFDIIAVYNFYKKVLCYEKINKKNIKRYENFDSIITEYMTKFEVSFNKNEFYHKIGRVLNWAKVYELLIIKCNAKNALMLCYYNEAMYGLNLASFRTNINSIDIQHGPQGDLHAAYTVFFKVPNTGYSCISKYFWVWDKMSYNQLKDRLHNTEKHKVLLGGNPWVNFLKNNLRSNDKFPKKTNKIILYSLQPIKPFVPEILLNALKITPNDYSWWFRMHPRMTQSDSEGIKQVVKDYGLLDIINFKEATNLPLPLILDNSYVHISKSSGCVLEASMLGVPNIIIDPIGKNYYKNIIDNKANFYQDKGDLWNLIYKIERKNRENKLVDFVPVLKSLLKQS